MFFPPFFPRRGEYTGSLELVKDLEPENSKETKCGFFFRPTVRT